MCLQQNCVPFWPNWTLRPMVPKWRKRGRRCPPPHKTLKLTLWLTSIKSCLLVSVVVKLYLLPHGI
ncbi:Uncharacterised protein [Vibrio cholerae]|nr:Uncharacterised protein [Vibrio cholerae]